MGFTAVLLQYGIHMHSKRLLQLDTEKRSEELSQEVRHIMASQSPREQIARYLNDVLLNAPIPETRVPAGYEKLRRYVSRSLTPLARRLPSLQWYLFSFVPDEEIVQMGMTHGLRRIWKFPLVINLPNAWWKDLFYQLIRTYGTWTFHTSPSSIRFNQFGDIISLFVPSFGFWIADSDRFSHLLASSVQHQPFLTANESELLFSELRSRFIGARNDHSLYGQATDRQTVISLFPGNLWWGINHAMPMIGFGQLSTVVSGRGPLAFYWLPLFPKSFLESTEWTQAEEKSAIELQLQQFRHLQAGFYLFCHPDQLTPDLGMWALGKSLSRRRFEILITDRRNKRTVFATRLFHDRSPLNQPGAEPDHGIRRGFITQQIVLGNKSSFDITIAQPLSQAASGGRQPGHISFFVLLFWYSAGILLLGHLYRFSGFHRMSVAATLAAGCFLILLPPLFQSLVNLESGALEQEARLERHAGTTISRILQSETDVHAMLSGFTGNLIRTHVTRFGRLMISPLRAAAEDASEQAMIQESLKRLGRRLMGYGGLVQYLFLFGPHGTMANFTNDPSTAKISERSQQFRNFYAQMYREFLHRLAPDVSGNQTARAQRDSMNFWLQFEELLTLITSVLPTESFLEMFLSPGAFTQADFFANQSTFLHVPIFDRGHARFVFQANCQRDSITPNFLRLMSKMYHSLGQFQISVWPTWHNNTFLALRPPYQIVEFGRMLSGKHEFPFPQWPTMARLAESAMVQHRPVFGTRGTGEERQMLAASTSETWEGYVFCAALSIGQVFKKAGERHRLIRWILGGVALAALFLAIMVVRLVARPVRRLTAAVRQVIKGDFSATLPIDSRDEIGRLNQAFNQMVRGVQERRHLSRFLSDSVRQAVQDDGLKAGMASASTRIVTVLFAGVTGLREKRQHLPPDLLMADLNELIERMAARIVAHRGVVDKIMGDKLLAVFFHDDGASPRSVVAGALQAATELCHSVSQLPAWHQESVGVGLVTGPVISGIMGTPEIRLEMTVIGDTVNLASRLCDLAILLPGGGIVSETESRRHLEAGTSANESRKFYRLSVSRVKGKSREVEVFQIRS